MAQHRIKQIKNIPNPGTIPRQHHVVTPSPIGLNPREVTTSLPPIREWLSSDTVTKAEKPQKQIKYPRTEERSVPDTGVSKLTWQFPAQLQTFDVL